ncbi:DNA-binding SARP family transcriptional activator [Streptomyces aurantiacus]|uniref:AfsR/SARP family transcriptional regulator n=1 Tax=Streptomyces aurantiacus TaxID=47760 RepID=UPI00279368CE|nr:BTAD domain-containing putative transcriptional regulator [Streptomyces aurantiacus]MDQ0772948.1 DNA-binding SARP family transcriptional activator [Streptomyces aurantiacus]
MSAGLAALVAGVVFTARRRRRLRYRPGSGDRSDLATAPVVRALLTARDQADTPDADDNSNTGETSSNHALSAPTSAPAPQTLPAGARALGIKSNQALAWNLARTHGLGLIGPGAYGAIRALLVSLLAEHPPRADGHAQIIVPAADARRLFEENLAGERNLERLRIVDDLDAALDTLERELLSRARLAPEPATAADSESTPHAELVLVATPEVHAERRLQAILDNGAALGLAGVLLGQWHPGGTARVREDGTVVAASASVADRLTAARLFTLPASDGQALLDLLGDAESIPQTSASRFRTTTPPPITEPEPQGSEHSSNTSSTAQKKPRRGLAQRPVGSREPLPSDVSSSTVSVNAERRARSSDDRVSDDRRIPPHSESRAPAHCTTSEARPSGRHMPTEAPPLRLTVLGRMRLTHYQHDGDEHADLSAALAPKQREVLAYLAVYEDGARRESLTTAIWPDAPKDRPYNSFHATLSQLRRALRTATHDAHSDITIHADGHYSLDRNLITVDLWQLRDALRTSRHSSDDELRRAAVERVLGLYSGDLAADLSAEWLVGPRESLRRDVLDAVSNLVRILRGEPEQALALLERVRTLDPYNEAVYRDIARFQGHLGQRDAIVRTFTLLTTKLAEIDEQPSQETSALYNLLQRPRSEGQGRSGRKTR